MGALRDGFGVIIALVYFYITIKFILPMVSAAPLHNISLQDPADDRMVKPPRFPYGGPFGFYSSGLLCKFDGTVYLGGWFGRSCAGPIAPFIQPTPPPTFATTPTPATTTTEPPTTSASTPIPYQSYSSEQLSWFQMLMNYNNAYGNNNHHHYEDPEDDYGEEIEGNPWEPDSDAVFIETYGRTASKPGFKLGDPNQRK